MQQFGPLMQAGKIDEADALLERALKLLDAQAPPYFAISVINSETSCSIDRTMIVSRRFSCYRWTAWLTNNVWRETLPARRLCFNITQRW